MGEYSKKTLLHNWLEDRLVPPQEHQDYSGPRVVRDIDYNLLIDSKVGGVKPLTRIARACPHVSKVVPDDGFRESSTSYNHFFKDPVVVRDPFRQIGPPMITEQTVKDPTNDQRLLPQQCLGFGCPIPPRDHEEFNRHLQTTHWDAYGRPLINTPSWAGNPSVAPPAGTSTAHVIAKENRPARVTLSGERLKENGWDAAYDTRVNRAWLGRPDNAVEALSALSKANKDGVDLKSSLRTAAAAALSPPAYNYESVVDPRVMKSKGRRSLFTLERTRGCREKQPTFSNYLSINLTDNNYDSTKSYARVSTEITRSSHPGLTGGEQIWSDVRPRNHGEGTIQRKVDTLVLLPTGVYANN